MEKLNGKGKNVILTVCHTAKKKYVIVQRDRHSKRGVKEEEKSVERDSENVSR